jgi:hypothetical protein
MKTYWQNFLKKDRAEQLFLLLIFGLVGLGLLLRARHYLAGRSLWLDEAMLALNVQQLSFAELTQQPLPYEQGAPFGFLFFTKASVLFFGDSEYAFRLFSFLTGIGAVGIFAMLAYKFLRKTGAFFALALFALAPFAIYYSAEAKQYMGDLFALLLVLLLYDRLRTAPFSNLRIGVFVLVASLLLWTSHASVFGIAAVGISLLWHFYQQQKMRAFWKSLAAFAFLALNFFLVYWFNIRPLSQNAFLTSFWEAAYMPLPPTFGWLNQMWIALLKNPLGLQIPVALALGLGLIGALWLWMRQQAFALPILLTLLLTLIAGALQKYPLAERMLLFWVPPIFLLFGAALDAIHALLQSIVSKLGKEPLNPLAFALTLALGMFLLGYPLTEGIEKFRKPLMREHIRPAMSYLKDNYRAGDTLYLYYFAEPAYLFYAPKYELEALPYVVGEKNQTAPERYLREIDEFALQGRTWFLFSHVYEDASINEEYYIRDYLKQVAEEKRLFRYPGSSVSLYLYLFRR